MGIGIIVVVCGIMIGIYHCSAPLGRYFKAKMAELADYALEKIADKAKQAEKSK